MWSTVSKHFSSNKLIILACLVIAAYLMPYYVLGENSHIRVHDNMDSNIVWYKMLAESGQIFSMPNATLPNVIDGLPRSALPSGLDAVVWLYVLFPPFTAYMISQTMMRFVAFFGMHVLLKRNVLGKDTGPIIPVGVALAFALLPYWPSGALSIAGLPLALHIFLTIRKNGRETAPIYWILMLLLPFFSNFILTFSFFIALIGLLWLIDWIRLKTFNLPFLAAIAGMTFIYFIKNYLLLVSMFSKHGFASHREEMNLGHKDLIGTWQLFLKNFIDSHTHVMDLHATIILPTICLGLLIAGYRKWDAKLLAGLLAANILFSLFYAFWYWEGMRVLKDNFMIFNSFNFSRIQFLRPLLWYLCFALALAFIWKLSRIGKVIVTVLIIAQCMILFPLTEEMKYSQIGTPTFKEFYSTELFQEIKTYIGKDQETYRVVSIAMHPAISQYNGFYTLDTYNNSFPLSYKRQFREMIAGELKKNPTLKSYYDTWGGRLYVYVSEIGKHYLFTKHSKKTIEQLDLNVAALLNLGGEYILSALPIENHDEIGLKFERSFEHADSPWKIYLYSVGDS